MGDVQPAEEFPLHEGPEGQVSRGVEAGQGHMGLGVTLKDPGRMEGLRDHDLGLLEALLHVSIAEADMGTDIPFPDQLIPQETK